MLPRAAADAPSLEKLECGSSSPRSQPWQSPQARAGDDAQGEVGAFISPAAGAGKNSPAFGHRSSSPCPRFLIISADLVQAPSTPHGPLPSLQPRLCPWQALGGAAKPSHRRCWDGRTGCVTSDISLQEGQGTGACWCLLWPGWAPQGVSETPGWKGEDENIPQKSSGMLG